MRSSRKESIVCLAFGLVLAFSGVVHPAELDEELAACASMPNRDARLACFDGVSENLRKQQAAAAEPAGEVDLQPLPEEIPEAATGDVPMPPEATAEAATNDVPMPDDLGGAEFADKEALKKMRFRGLVTSCKEGQTNDWYFFFENGQVWKEVTSRVLRFKDCHFSVTITKDGFGYKMLIDGQKRNIRISRRR